MKDGVRTTVATCSCRMKRGVRRVNKRQQAKRRHVIASQIGTACRFLSKPCSRAASRMRPRPSTSLLSSNPLRSFAKSAFGHRPPSNHWLTGPHSIEFVRFEVAGRADTWSFSVQSKRDTGGHTDTRFDISSRPICAGGGARARSGGRE